MSCPTIDTHFEVATPSTSPCGSCSPDNSFPSWASIQKSAWRDFCKTGNLKSLEIFRTVGTKAGIRGKIYEPIEIN